jgi:WhiB family redox-sensing transcriptional regulator
VNSEIDQPPPCREDPDRWFPIGQGPAIQRQIADAKAVCRACPFMVPCLTAALTEHRLDGIWGGYTWDERKMMRGVPESANRFKEIDAKIRDLDHLDQYAVAKTLHLDLSVVRRVRHAPQAVPR